MAGAGAMGGSGGTGGVGGTTGGAGGTGGDAGGGSGGTGGTAGMDPDEDSGVDDDAGSEPEPELPMDGEALSVCAETADCNGDDLVCAVFGTFQGYCAEDCAEDTDCAEVGGVQASCDSSDRCVIDCSPDGSDGDCPKNMECAEVTTNPILDPIFRCQYPQPKNIDLYEVCDPNLESADCKGELTCQMFPGLTDLRDSICAAGCTEPSDCDDLGSKATPVCDPEPLSPFDGICALDCDEDDDCPNDMTCIEVDLITNRCGHEI